MREKQGNMEKQMDNGKAENGTNGQQAPAMTRAIEVSKPSMAKAYEPTSYAEAIAMARTLAASSLLGMLKSHEAVYLLMATGAELGIPPTASLRAIHIVQGKPVLSADLIVAVCLRSQLCEYFTCIESTAASATYETKRKNSGPVRNTFNLEDARAAGLAGKDNWKNYGKAMLRHRAAAELARMVYPDLVLGIYSEEEGELMLASMPAAPAPLSVMPSVAASPTPSPAQQEIIDGEIIQGPSRDDSLTRLTAAYASAKTLEEVRKLRADVLALGLDKDGEDYAAMRALDRETTARLKTTKAGE